MTEKLKCGMCGLPIHPSEGGVRYFGFYVAHSENRCLSLLRSRIEELEALTRPQSDLTREGVAHLEAAFEVAEVAATALIAPLCHTAGPNTRQAIRDGLKPLRTVFADAILAMVPGGGGWSIPQAVIDASERLRADAANTMQHDTTSDLTPRLMCRVGVKDVALVLAWLDQHRTTENPHA